MCSARKYPHPPKGKSNGIPVGGGFNSKQCTRYEAVKLQFLEEKEANGEGEEKFPGVESFHGRGMNISGTMQS